MMYKNLKMAAVAGRHEIQQAVDGAVLDEVNYPADICGIEDAVFSRLNALFESAEYRGVSLPVNSADGEETVCHKTYGSLDLYVTGLTTVVLAVVKWCLYNGCHLTCWHYDRETGQYVPQVMVKGVVIS